MLYLLSSQIDNSIDWSGLEQLDQLNQAKPNQMLQILKESMPYLIKFIKSFAIEILIAILILVIGIKIIQVVSNMLRRSFERTNADVGAVHFIGSFVKGFLYLILVLLIGSRFGLKATSVIALLGSAGIAIGLALQASLSNFAAGMIILLMKPFKVGDFIIENNQGNEGVVVSIDVFYTKLVSIDNKLIVIPNSILVNNSVTNASSQDKRRLDIKVGISYQSSIKKAKELIMVILEQDVACLSDEEVVVFVDTLAESAVIIGCRFWVKAEDYLSAKWRITEEIKERFDENEIQIPFRQLDIRVLSEELIKRAKSENSET